MHSNWQVNDKNITICGGALPRHCHSLNPDLGTWDFIVMEKNRSSASSSLFGRGDDLLISGGTDQDYDEEITVTHKDLEIVDSSVNVTYHTYHHWKYNAFKLLTWSEVEDADTGNYWLDREIYGLREFYLEFDGEPRPLDTVVLVNTHNAHHRERAMKEFKVFLSLAHGEPYVEVVHQTLEDSRQQEDPLPVQKFPFSERTAKFVKFNQISYYGYGGGLQYFTLTATRGISVITHVR